MKKWYVITGILAALLAVSSVTCSSNSDEVDRLKDELACTQAELNTAKTDLAETRSELAQVTATKEISFGNGLRIFDIEKGYYEVCGKVENVSNGPIRKVVVLVAFYSKDGGLDEDWGSVGTDTITHLYPGEAMEWEVDFGNWTDQELGLFDVYAIGNRGE